MLRKTILTLATGAVLGAAALAPTSASARWGGGHWGGGHWGGAHWGHWGYYRPGIRLYAGPVYYGGCMVRRWVYTPWGPRVRWINRCY